MSHRELNLPDSVFEWRRRRDILPLENFDFPRAHVRSDFDHRIISSLTRPRMAGSSFQMSPDEIRDTIREGRFTDVQKSYLAEVFEQCDGLDIRLFRHLCGVSLYELARAMIECRVTHPFVAEWMNCRSPYYESPEIETRMYRLHSNLGR